MRVAWRFHRYVTLGPALLGVLAVWGAARWAPAADAYSEDQVKAAYLYRFAGYVEWSDGSPPDAPFVIAVFGSPGVARELRRLLPDHPVNHRVAQVREVTGAQDLGQPQILYAGRGHAQAARGRLLPTGPHSVLFVTDEEGGLNVGSVVNFLMIDRRVRFEVSMAAATLAGLRVSSELLGVAVRVITPGRDVG